MNKIEKRIIAKKDYSNIWKSVASESIDYALLEKSNSIYTVKADFKWNDLGSWSSVYDVSSKSKEKNAIRGSGVVIDGSNNLIESKKQFTAIIGVSNLVVITTPDATLVVPKEKAQEVKDIVLYLEKKKRHDLL